MNLTLIEGSLGPAAGSQKETMRNVALESVTPRVGEGGGGTLQAKQPASISFIQDLHNVWKRKASVKNRLENHCFTQYVFNYKEEVFP